LSLTSRFFKPQKCRTVSCKQVLEDQTPTPESLAEERKLNFGVERVELLRFNIGYLDLRAFGSPQGADEKFGAAMRLLGDTDALLIDLRFNGGGDPATVALLASYLFDGRTRLNDIYDRGTDKTTQYWTSNTVAGPKYGSTRKLIHFAHHAPIVGANALHSGRPMILVQAQ
jgi:retinol-binding protein 3